MTHAEKRAEQEFPDLEFKGIIEPSSKRLLKQSIEASRTAFIAGWEADKWIRVEDELPDFEVDVDVYGFRKQSHPQMGGSKPITFISRRRDLRGTPLWKSRERQVDENDFICAENITHWQPRPSPPKTK
jgi:hypothetical protein